VASEANVKIQWHGYWIIITSMNRQTASFDRCIGGRCPLSASLIYHLPSTPWTTTAKTRASVWLVWHSAPVDSIILVRQDIPCCVRRYVVVRCPRYVLGSARLNFELARTWGIRVFFILYIADLADRTAEQTRILHFRRDEMASSADQLERCVFDIGY